MDTVFKFLYEFLGQEYIQKAFAKKEVRYQKIKHYSLPSDFATVATFPEGDYLKVYCYEVKK